MSIISMHNPQNVTFGPGCIDQMGKDYIARGGKRIFVISVKPVFDRLTIALNSWTESGITIQTNLTVQAEPTLDDVERILAEARDFRPDTVAGIGGGSVMDLAKLIAVFITFRKPVLDYVGTDKLTERRTHLICAPSTSGTGSEVSPNAIITDESDHLKKGFISPLLVPDAAYIDPSLTLGLSPTVTAYTGIDALTHCIEAYSNRNAHPLTDTLALKGISLIARNLIKAIENINDLQPRISLALGSLYGGMCLGPVNTAAIHALAYPLGSEYKIPHGLSNALLLPYVMEFNMDAAVERYAKIAVKVGVKKKYAPKILAARGITLIRKLIADCGLPGTLHEAGIEMSAIENIAISAMEVQRLLKNNIKEITLKEAIDIYQHAF